MKFSHQTLRFSSAHNILALNGSNEWPPLVPRGRMNMTIRFQLSPRASANCHRFRWRHISVQTFLIPSPLKPDKFISEISVDCCTTHCTSCAQYNPSPGTWTVCVASIGACQALNGAFECDYYQTVQFKEHFFQLQRADRMLLNRPSTLLQELG